MRRRTLFLLAVALAALACSRPSTVHREVTFVAAASLRGVLPELARAYEAKHPGQHIVASYGASGTLQKQVEGGAPVDGVAFASDKPVDALARAGKLAPGSQRAIARNTIVLIGPKGSKPLTFSSLGSLPPGQMVAIGDPGAVPAGQYARSYLVRLGLWDRLSGRLVLGGDVSAVLAYARRGEVAAAIVYRTEIRGISDVVLLDEAKGPEAPKPEVVGGVVAGSAHAPEAAAFLGFVTSPEGQKILSGFGFGPP
jgi:molybdate transport system substrate-binding protein